MWRMLQQNEPRDFVIATGKSYTLKDFVEETFKQLNLDWHKYVVINQNFFRPSEIIESHADPSLANKLLDWRAENGIKKIIDKMLNSDF